MSVKLTELTCLTTQSDHGSCKLSSSQRAGLKTSESFTLIPQNVRFRTSEKFDVLFAPKIRKNQNF